MYKSHSEVDVYDQVYQDRKDYQAEAEAVARLIRARKPDASTLLDVACGTGIHLQAFASLFGTVEGLDISDSMFDRANQRLPGVPLHLADMRSFQLGKKFDAIVCMFSSIGYLASVDDLDSTLASMARHLTPGGVVVIEPWYTPTSFIENYVSSHLVTTDGRTIARVSHSTREGDATRMEIHYLIADASGVHHQTDIDRLTLFTADQYENAFTMAGGKVEHVGDTGLGYYVGIWQ